MRRSGYKGQVEATNFNLPVDTCTLPGLLCCLACFLQNRGLQKEAVNQVWGIIDKLDSQGNFRGTVRLLPDVQNCHLSFEANETSLESWHEALELAGLGACVAATAKHPSSK